jgi:hypothetical protein
MRVSLAARQGRTRAPLPLHPGSRKSAVLGVREDATTHALRVRRRGAQLILIGMPPMKSRLPMSTPQWRRMA